MVTVGIDEVGRGCLAGPVVAGAVVLERSVKGLKDSKLLSKKQREELARIIEKQALAIGLGWVDAATIDRIGLTAAVRQAMHTALEQIRIDYPLSNERIIIDGNYNFLSDISNTETMIKADALVPAVSAAGIIAKVARDNYMAAIAADYPDYGFTSHVGYGTALHLERLKLHGISTLHRRSFQPVAALLNEAV